jgi:serine phosphatase RsbU (regulator of sigma subunit)
MSSLRWFGLIAVLLAAAFAGSGVLYMRSRSANFDAHARAVGAMGNAQKLGELLSKNVLSARFGLLNQYDPITNAELDLAASAEVLPAKIGGAVVIDAELARALSEFQRAVDDRRQVVEHFKAENSVLKNSLRYLPTAAEEMTARIAEQRHSAASAETTRAVQALVRGALVYNLIGDASTRAALLSSIERVASLESRAPESVVPDLRLVLAHARVIADRQPSVDGWVKRAVSTDAEDHLRKVEKLYEARFTTAAAQSNHYRKILYGWSLVLVLAVAVAGVQLRRLYAGLERRVAERTRELHEAHDALWGEMKLARKIQEALVPSSPTLGGCEVAAIMKPTSQVGGDYYDVISEKGAEWVLIGDVSGHGVPAGLIMMMCQTAVRTALSQNPELLPHQLLTIVNRVLTRNITSLGEDKYMTISALRRDPDGMISFAGAHQDIHVYRADLDRVEALETSGLWLGLRQDVDGAFATRRLRLADGDVLVLHTDGVTEAARGGVLFDTRGLRTVVERAKGKTAHQILDELMRALDGFELADDATVLVIRQLDQARLEALAG